MIDDVQVCSVGLDVQRVVKSVPIGSVRAGQAKASHFPFGGRDAVDSQQRGRAGGRAGGRSCLQADADVSPVVLAHWGANQQRGDGGVTAGNPECRDADDPPPVGDSSPDDSSQERRGQRQKVSDYDQVGNRKQLGEPNVIPSEPDVENGQQDGAHGHSVSYPAVVTGQGDAGGERDRRQHRHESQSQVQVLHEQRL